jgi:tetratricopeptide (TPR) repeat protein
VYLRSEGLELLIGDPNETYALLGVHIPSHPRDIPSARLIATNLDEATKPHLHQKANALVALWSEEELETLRASQAILQSLEDTAPGTELAEKLATFMDDDLAQRTILPWRLLNHLGRHELQEALELWDQHRPTLLKSNTTAALFAVSMARILKGKAGKVREHLETLPSTLPVAAHVGHARIALHLDAPDLALHHWRQAVDYNDPRDLIGLAEVALKAGDDSTAHHVAEQARLLEPQEPSLLERMAEVFVHSGSPDVAIQLLVAGKTDRGRLRAAEIALYQADVATAIGFVREPESDELAARRESILGCAYVLNGDYEEAIDLLTRRDDHGVNAAFWLVEAYLRLHRYDEGLAVLRSVKDRMGEHPVERLLLGVIAIPKTWRKSDHKHRSIVAAILGDGPDFESMTDAEEQALILNALTRLAGNRSTELTCIEEDGSLRSLRHIVSPRTKAIRTQHQIRSRSLDWVNEQFDTFQAEEPTIPFWLTYSAELNLWNGSYEAAEEAFRASWNAEQETRWMYVGLGAALTMLGQHAEALEVFEKGISKLGEMSPGEATWAYRGEIALCAGNTDKAVEELEKALSLRPSRVGTRCLLALACIRNGHPEHAMRVAKEGGSPTAALYWEAHRALNLTPNIEPATADLEPVLLKSVELLLGNRSSFLLTFRASDGHWCVHPIEGHTEACAALATRLAPLAWQDIASRLISRPWLELTENQ